MISAPKERRNALNAVVETMLDAVDTKGRAEQESYLRLILGHAVHAAQIIRRSIKLDADCPQIDKKEC